MTLTTLNRKNGVLKTIAVHPQVDNEIELLQQCTLKNTPMFNLNNYKCLGKYISVYDGDTATFAIVYPDGNIYRTVVRCAGIDTAEMKSKDPTERETALKAKNLFISLMDKSLNKLVWLEFCDPCYDKYQRLLAYVYDSKDKDSIDISKSFNMQMIANGLAYAYEGGTKVEFSEWGST
jgi:endonuclease YncB( thermonuclease family)